MLRDTRASLPPLVATRLSKPALYERALILSKTCPIYHGRGEKRSVLVVNFGVGLW